MKPAGPKSRIFRWLVAIAGCVALTSCAQRAGGTLDTKLQTYDHPPAGRHEAVEAYLEMKTQELNKSYAALQAVGRAQEIDAIYRLVNQGDRFSTYDVAGDTPQQRADVVRALALTAAHYLASVGMTAAKIEESKKAGVDVTASAVEVIAGGAGFDDLMAVSETAVVAVVSGVEQRVSSAVVTLEVIDASDENMSASPSVKSLQTNLAVGAECLFFLSRSLAEFRDVRDGAGTFNESVAQQFEPFCKRDGRYVATSAYMNATADADEVRALLEAKKLLVANW